MATVTSPGFPSPSHEPPAPSPDLSPEPGDTSLLSKTWYRNYVLGLLTLCYVANVIDRSQILAASLQAIKREFGASDAQLGMLSGLPFALFYSFLGIPIAAWADRSNRRNVLAVAVATWSGMTALCGAAVNLTMLFAARIGTAIGEAGGSPPSHSLISDYFPKSRRATAFSTFALAVPIGTALGATIGGWGNEHYGWRATFMMVGLPGILVALVVRATIIEPPRGYADNVGRPVAKTKVPGMMEVFRFLWKRPSFRHLTLAAGLHSVVWYAGGAFNNAFFQRSHLLSVSQASYWISIFAIVGATGTFIGGFAADRLSTRLNDRRWYMWVPGIATLVSVPFQFLAYLTPGLTGALVSFAGMQFLAAVFFGPSFTMTQALATLRMRSVATALLLLVQTLIGQGFGPSFTGIVSDWLAPSMGRQSLRYALVVVGLVNVWAALHYIIGARSLRRDLEATEKLAVAG